MSFTMSSEVETATYNYPENMTDNLNLWSTSQVTTFDDSVNNTNVTKVAQLEFPDYGYTLIGLYLLIVGIIATAGNLTVIIVIMSDRKLRKKAHNKLLLNLAVSDLGISIFGYPATTAAGFAGYWVWGDVGCQISGFMCTLLALTDINTLLALSVYRYMVICKPHLQYVVESARVSSLVIGVTWLYSLFWALSALLGWNRYEMEAFGTSCSIDWDSHAAGDISYTILMILTCYISHVVVMVYCYIQVNIVSKRTSMRLHGKSYSPNDAVLQNKLHGEQKVTVMAVLMVGSFTLIWSPYAWASVWTIVNPPIPLWVAVFPTMFAKSSCMVNPIIYGFTNPKFRQSAHMLWACRRMSVVNDVTMAAIQARQNNTHVYTIECTKEGIYTGERQIQLEHHAPIF